MKKDRKVVIILYPIQKMNTVLALGLLAEILSP